jgi:pimeloyl-ACP methyl ester carboxylesterase
MTQSVGIAWRDQRVDIEYTWIDATRTDAPLLIFLHEGLGSLRMWKDFPQQLCDAAQCRGLVYSRPGYGNSTPRAAEVCWGSDFLHQQAFEVLPALLQALHVSPATPTWLLGHSDGASIALLYASHFTSTVAGCIALAPHILVEEVTLRSIDAARQAYLTTDLPQRLGQYHRDPDSAFWGWNNAWLDPAFQSWNIESALEKICCPVLAVQGQDDPYGTLAQIRGIARRVPQTELLELSDCGHSPHRDQTEKMIKTASAFIHKH